MLRFDSVRCLADVATYGACLVLYAYQAFRHGNSVRANGAWFNVVERICAAYAELDSWRRRARFRFWVERLDAA